MTMIGTLPWMRRQLTGLIVSVKVEMSTFISSLQKGPSKSVLSREPNKRKQSKVQFIKELPSISSKRTWLWNWWLTNSTPKRECSMKRHKEHAGRVKAARREARRDVISVSKKGKDRKAQNRFSRCSSVCSKMNDVNSQFNISFLDDL